MEETVVSQLREVVQQTVDYLPHLIAGLGIVILGWLVAWVAKKLVIRSILLLRLHRMFEKSRWGAAMSKADVRYTLIEGVGNVVFVFVFLVFLDSAIVAWKLEVLASLLGSLVAFLPQLVVAAVIFATGIVAASYVGRRVETFLDEAEFEHAFLVGGLAKAGVIVFVVAMSLDHLDVAPRIVLASFLITGGSLGAAVILAVGLGSQHAVRKFWEGVTRGDKSGSRR